MAPTNPILSPASDQQLNIYLSELSSVLKPIAGSSNPSIYSTSPPRRRSPLPPLATTSPPPPTTNAPEWSELDYNPAYSSARSVSLLQQYVKRAAALHSAAPSAATEELWRHVWCDLQQAKREHAAAVAQAQLLSLRVEGGGGEGEGEGADSWIYPHLPKRVVGDEVHPLDRGGRVWWAPWSRQPDRVWMGGGVYDDPASASASASGIDTVDAVDDRGLVGKGRKQVQDIARFREEEKYGTSAAETVGKKEEEKEEEEEKGGEKTDTISEKENIEGITAFPEDTKEEKVDNSPYESIRKAPALRKGDSATQETTTTTTDITDDTTESNNPAVPPRAKHIKTVAPVDGAFDFLAPLGLGGSATDPKIDENARVETTEYGTYKSYRAPVLVLPDDYEPRTITGPVPSPSYFSNLWDRLKSWFRSTPNNNNKNKNENGAPALGSADSSLDQVDGAEDESSIFSSQLDRRGLNDGLASFGMVRPPGSSGMLAQQHPATSDTTFHATFDRSCEVCAGDDMMQEPVLLKCPLFPPPDRWETACACVVGGGIILLGLTLCWCCSRDGAIITRRRKLTRRRRLIAQRAHFDSAQPRRPMPTLLMSYL